MAFDENDLQGFSEAGHAPECLGHIAGLIAGGNYHAYTVITAGIIRLLGCRTCKNILIDAEMVDQGQPSQNPVEQE